MKKSLKIVALSSLVGLAAAASLLTPGQVRSGDVSIREAEAFAYVCLEEKGPFDKLEEAIGRLVQEMQGQNIVPAGPLLGIYYNSPEEAGAENLRWEVGFPVTSQALVQPPLGKKEWSYTQFAVSLHVGAYDQVGETIRKMLDWMEQNGYRPAGPVMERYMDMNPAEIRPEELRTEVWIPCEKKS